MSGGTPCPHCGRIVSDAATYIFIPSENLRWHDLCYREAHPEPSQDQPEEVNQ